MMIKKPDVHRLIEIQRLWLQFHSIERSIRHPHDFDRHESDTEHSYSLAMTAWMVAQYFSELNRDTVIRLALVHDLCEIHAGDTFAYASADIIATKAEREAKAINQLSKEWPDFPEMIDAIHEYEALETNESKFVFALDKLIPVLLNYLNQGKTWRYDQVTIEDVMTAKDAKISVSPQIYVYYKEILAVLQNHPEYFHKPKTASQQG